MDADCPCLRDRSAGGQPWRLQQFRFFLQEGRRGASDEPADRLYNEGLYLLNAKKDPKQAVKKFEEVDRQHPYSEWARKSLIMSSYAYYQAGEYDDCVNSAKRYITLHPGGADAAYAQYPDRLVLLRRNSGHHA